jgi:hypothetical protein
VKIPKRKSTTILDKRIFNALKYQNAEEENLARKKILIVDD